MRRPVAEMVWGSLLFVALAAAPVRADSAVLLPPRVEDASQASSTEARAALAEALTMQGLALLDFAAARRRMGLTASCARSDCGPQLLEAEIADITATVTVSLDAQGSAARVFVTLTDRNRQLYEAEATVERNDVRAATTRALLEARSLQLLGPGPWLRVDGAPDGAEVVVDGKVVGTLPYRGRVAPGAHQLRVQAEGYEVFESDLDVPETGRRKFDVDARLAPGALRTSEIDQGDDVADGHDSSSETWITLPLIMGGAGLALATVTTVRLASGLDSCVEADAEGRCTARREVQLAPTVVYYSLSAALIGGAIAWLVLGAPDDDAQLTAEVGVTSAAISGRF